MVLPYLCLETWLSALEPIGLEISLRLPEERLPSMVMDTPLMEMVNGTVSSAYIDPWLYTQKIIGDGEGTNGGVDKPK